MNQHQDYDKIFKENIDLFEKQNKKEAKITKIPLQLEMLSNLRKLQPLVIKSLEDMSLNYDIQTDLRYLQGVETGIEQGIEQGASKAIHDVVISLLSKFPNWSDAEIAEVANTTLENVMRIRAEM